MEEKDILMKTIEALNASIAALSEDQKIRGRFFDPFLIKGLKYPVRNKSH